MSGIFKPWYEKKDRALGSIKFMTNQVKLKEAALNAPDSAVRVFAASKISDKAIVTELIHQREYGDVAERALDVLQTREELTAVANDDAVLLNVRIKAAKKLDDEPLTETLTEKFHLVKAIQSSSESEVEKYVNLLRLDRSLIECVLRFNNAQFKRFAIGKIREDTALEEIIAAIGEKHQTDYLYYSEFSGVLDTAVQRIKAPEALERLSASKYECVRCSAVEQIKDPALLEKIAVSDDTPSIRYQAAKNCLLLVSKKSAKPIRIYCANSIMIIITNIRVTRSSTIQRTDSIKQKRAHFAPLFYYEIGDSPPSVFTMSENGTLRNASTI